MSIISAILDICVIKNNFHALKLKQSVYFECHFLCTNVASVLKTKTKHFPKFQDKRQKTLLLMENDSNTKSERPPQGPIQFNINIPLREGGRRGFWKGEGIKTKNST